MSSRLRFLLLQVRNAGGTLQWVPMNLVSRWYWVDGATDAEVSRAMPGDDLLPGSGSATRAVTVAAPPRAML